MRDCLWKGLEFSFAHFVYSKVANPDLSELTGNPAKHSENNKTKSFNRFRFHSSSLYKNQFDFVVQFWFLNS